MQAMRHSTDIVEVRDGEKQFEYNLNYGVHRDQLIKQVGKIVFDLLTFTKEEWIDSNLINK